MIAANVVAVGSQARKFFVKHRRHPLTVVQLILFEAVRRQMI